MPPASLEHYRTQADLKINASRNGVAIPPHPLQCMICRDCSGPRCDKSQQSCHQIPLFTWCKLQNCPEILQTHLGWVSSNVPSSRNYMKPLATKDRHKFLPSCGSRICSVLGFRWPAPLFLYVGNQNQNRMYQMFDFLVGTSHAFEDIFHTVRLKNQ